MHLFSTAIRSPGQPRLKSEVVAAITTDVFDIGALLPELAALEGRRSFSVLILPGVESQMGSTPSGNL